MQTRRPIRTRTGVNPVNKERKATLREKQYGDEAFVMWLHRLECAIPGCHNRDVEAAHVGRSRAAGGTWQDVAPVCKAHHSEQHTLGILSWEQKYAVSGIGLAEATQKAWRAHAGE